MREVREETGLGPDEIEAFYDLDQVAPFYDEGVDAVVVSAIFAARVRPDAEPRASWEHDGLRWVPAARGAAASRSGRRTPTRSGGSASSSLDPALAPWFALDADGGAHRPPPDRGA